MKKYVILSLLCIPLAAFAAPSVRMLGEKSSGVSNANSSMSAVKTVPAKPATMTGTDSNAQRVGTVGLKNKVGNVVTKKSGSDGDSRFPAISPKHIYTSVETPKQTNPTTIVNNNVDTEAIINAVLQRVDEDYYDKIEIDDMLPSEDPRVDMIAIAKPGETLSEAKLRQKWKNADIPDGYVFMWVEQ